MDASNLHRDPNPARDPRIGIRHRDERRDLRGGDRARSGFTKATVSAWRVTLEERGLGSSSIIVRMSAIRKLAVEATDNGLLIPCTFQRGHQSRFERFRPTTKVHRSSREHPHQL